MAGGNKTAGVAIVLGAAVGSFTLLMLATDGTAPEPTAPRAVSGPDPAPVLQPDAGSDRIVTILDAGCSRTPDVPLDQDRSGSLSVPARPPLRRRPPSPKPAATPGLQAVMTVPDTVPPPLEVLAPRDRSYVKVDRVELRVSSEAGARVSAEGVELAEQHPGVFAAQVTLAPGRNHVRITARDAVGNQSQALVRITCVDPGRYGRFKDRLDALLDQLDEIHQASLEIDARTAEILHALRDAGDAAEVARLGRAQQEVRRAKRALQEEIEKAIMEIDMILSRRAQ